MNGKKNLIMSDNNNDFKSEIRNSGYADMLNDSDRNMQYYHALKHVIGQMKTDNLQVHVLDIGCGTGILSMMALDLGADRVTACESFQPMYECARTVLADNKLLTDKIDLVHCNSADLQVGVNMRERANVLVSEVFDTELLGEGVLPTFQHARKNLLTANAVVIPWTANIFVQIVDSDFLTRHSWLDNKSSKPYFPDYPPSFDSCRGYSSVFDIQASALTNYSLKPGSGPILVKQIDLSRITDEFRDRVSLSVPCDGDRASLAFVVWWQLVMVAGDDSCITTAPRWACSDDSEYKWRDHWLQAVYCPRMPLIDTDTVTVDFAVCHDTFSLWIDTHDRLSMFDRPFCTCGVHLHLPHNRLFQLNSADYRCSVDTVTRLAISQSVTHAVVISDVSYLTASLPRAGIATSGIVGNESLKRVVQQLVDANRYRGTISLSTLEDFEIDIADGIDCCVGVFGDPFFVDALLPWENIHFWYAAEHVRRRCGSGTRCVVSPQRMRIRAMLVEFDDLQKVDEPVGSVAGFDLRAFDELIGCGRGGEIEFEGRFLWEYGCRGRSAVGDVMTVDMRESIEALCEAREELIGECVLPCADWAAANALVAWAVWEIDDCVWVDDSLLAIDGDGARVHWQPYTKQAVHFLAGLETENRGEIVLRCALDLRNEEFRFLIG